MASLTVTSFWYLRGRRKKKGERVSFKKEIKEIIFYLAWLVLKL